MKYIFLILFTATILLSQENRKNPTLEKSIFTIKDSKVYANGTLIANADASSFKVIDALCHGDEDKHCFGFDKKHVYYYSKELPGADPATFQILSNGYSADKKNVYYIMDNVFKLVKGVDRNTFQVLGIPAWSELSYAYAKDKKAAYYDGIKLKGSEGSSFELISKKGKYHAKDKFNFYNQEKSTPNGNKKKKKIIRR